MLFLGNIEDILNTNSSISELAMLLSDEPLSLTCADINYVQLNQGTFDDVDLEVFDKDTTTDDIDNYEFPEVWHKFIVFHANFNNNNLAAGNFEYMIADVNSLIIKRRDYNSTESYLPIFEKQIYTNIDANEFNFTFTDYLVRNNKEYEYKLVPILKNGMEGFPIYATYEDDNNRKLNFNGIFICEPNSVYSTIMETDITANKDIADTLIKPLGREYSVVFRGSLNKGYIGTAKGLFAPTTGNCEWDFANAWEYRDKFNEFLLDKQSKILKSDDGRMWLINVYDQVTNEKDDHIYKVITTFNWVETGDVNDVYTLYDNGFISYNPYTKALEITDEFDYSSVIYTSKVIDVNQNPIASIKITLYDNNGNVINTTQTNNLGQFSFSKLKNGEYKVIINTDRYISKTVLLTVINHKVCGNSVIVLQLKSEETTDSDRTYLTNWKVVKSTNNNDFIESDILQNGDLPSELNNTSSENAIVVLESDFSIKKGDIISLFIQGNYEVFEAQKDGINKPICSAILYTGISDYESTTQDYEEIASVTTTIVMDDLCNASANSTSTVNGDVKLLLLLENFEANDTTSILEYLSISINVKNIF